MISYNNAKILIVRERESIIVRSISMRLKEMGLSFEVAGETVEEVSKKSEGINIFIVYMSELSENVIKSLIYIIDLAIEDGIFLIVIGNRDHYSILAKAVPSITSKIWIDRPLDMAQFNIILEDLLMDLQRKSEKKSILIVDDDPGFAKMIREWIRDRYQVYVVTAGMQAITFLFKKKVDLILLDYEMPIVDGPQVLQMLRQDVETAHIPVVFLTGVQTKEAVTRVMSLKPNGYLLKSTPRADLLRFLEQKLE